MQNPTLQPPSFACRWDWCRATFSTHKSLVDHVVDDHIKTAKPVKRKDVSLIRRVEEGDSGLTENLLANTGATESQSTDYASSAPRPSPVATVRTPSPSRAYHSPALTPPPSTPPRVVQSRSSFNQYVAQSSPAVTPSVPSVSESPALLHLVSNAINDLSGPRSRGSPVAKRLTKTRTSQQDVEGTSDVSEQASQPHAPLDWDVSTSTSTSSSQDVESQLTQGLDIQQSPLQAEAFRISADASQTLQTTSSSLAHHASSQAWYQSHPHPSSFTPHTNRQLSPSQSQPGSQQHKMPHAHSHPHHPFTFTFRSNAIRITPVPSTQVSGPSTQVSGNGSTSAHVDRPAIHVHHVHHNHRHDHPHAHAMADDLSSTPSRSSSAPRAEDLPSEDPVSQPLMTEPSDSQQSLPLYLQIQTQAPYQSLESQSSQ